MDDAIKLSGKTCSCPVCEKNTALEEGTGHMLSWLCVNCGYTSNTTFYAGNEQLESSPKAILEARFWDNTRQVFWIPTVINMPTRGLVCPETHGKKIVWMYIPMVAIPVEEQKNYPVQNEEGKYHDKKLDTDNIKYFTEFYDALKELGAIVELDELKENIIERGE